MQDKCSKWYLGSKQQSVYTTGLASALVRFSVNVKINK